MPFATKSYDNGIPYTQTFDNSGGSGGNLPLYVGIAEPGTSKSSPYWKIYKLTYDGNDAVTDIQWASGNTNMDKTWNNRANYTYS